MNRYISFLNAIEQGEMPADLSVSLQALWHDRMGDWQTAHQLVADENDADTAQIHAYLHRKEGDLANADYWYRRSGTRRPQASLAQEWDDLVRARFSQ